MTEADLDDSSLVPLSEHTAFLTAQVGFLTAYRFADALAPLGIGPRQFETLKLLQGLDG